MTKAQCKDIRFQMQRGNMTTKTEIKKKVINSALDAFHKMIEKYVDPNREAQFDNVHYDDKEGVVKWVKYMYDDEMFEGEFTVFSMDEQSFLDAYTMIRMYLN